MTLTWPDLATVVVSGMLLGALYGLMSYGLGLIYGVMKIVNLAHGAMLTLGAYGTLWLYTNYHIDPLLSIPLTAVGGFVIGVLLEISLVKRIRQAPPISSLLLLFGVCLVAKNVLYLSFGGDDQSILTSYTFERLDLGIPVGLTRFLVFGISLLCFGGLQYLLHHTYPGRAIRAVAQDSVAAALAGINVDRVSAMTFGLGSALAAIAGSLMALIYSFNPEFGGSFLLKSFCVVVLGGLESTIGILLGGFVLGLAESMSVVVLPASFQDLVSFVLLVAILVIRPPRTGQKP